MLELDSVAVEDCCNESGGKEAPDDNGGERGVIVGCRWVRNKADVEEKHGEDCWEEDEGRGRAEREDGGKDHGDGQEGPAEILDAGRGDIGEEGERFREGGVERDGSYAVSVGRGEVCMGTGKGDDAAAAFFIADHAGVDSCLANKGVRTVNVWRCGLDSCFFYRASDDKRSPIDVFASYSVRCGNMDGSAVGRTSKGLVGVVERTTSVSIESTTVAPRPDSVSFSGVEGSVWSLTSNLLHTRSVAACRNLGCSQPMLNDEAPGKMSKTNIGERAPIGLPCVLVSGNIVRST